MYLFFTNDIRDGLAWFSEEEARHFLQALRKKKGDAFQFTDGRGGWYEAVAVETGKRHLVAEIAEAKRLPPERDFRLHIAIAPTKSIDRFEWFLEKATEIGVDEITALRCEHSERNAIRTDRLEKIILTAMKQSLRAYLPVLNGLTDFSKFISNFSEEENAGGFIAHCRSEELPHLKNRPLANRNITLLIGPEGDFSEREIMLAENSGFESVSLGKARLRTETAGIVACHLVNLLHS